MQPSPLLLLFTLVTACAGIDEKTRAEATPQEKWDRAYAEGASAAPPAEGAALPDRGSESPYPGYALDPGTNAYVWTPGATHSLRAHQSAGQVEGVWIPDPGYAAALPGSTQVEWQPSLRHPTRAHVIAGTRTGLWVAERGYVLDDEGRARWAPGRPDPSDPELEAGVGEGTWVKRPEQDRAEGAETPPVEPLDSAAATPAPAPDPDWAAVDGALETAARVQAQIDEERRARGVERAGVLTDLTRQLDTAIDAAVDAAFPAEAPAGRREVRAVALSGLESGFEGWATLGKERSAAASSAVQKRSPAVVDVDGALEFFVRLRRAAERLGANAPGSVN